MPNHALQLTGSVVKLTASPHCLAAMQPTHQRRQQGISNGGTIMKRQLAIMIVFVGICFGTLANTGWAGEAAPFTKDAGSKISKLFIENKTQLDKIRNEEIDPTVRAGKIIKLGRNIYTKAGYDFDATIISASKYLTKYNNTADEIANPNLIHTPFQNVIEMLLLIAGDKRARYIDFFNSNTAKAVDHIYKTVILNLKL